MALMMLVLDEKVLYLYLKKLGMIPDHYTTIGCDTRNRKRILMAESVKKSKPGVSQNETKIVTWTIEDHYRQKY